jgi:hypothetical protein
VTLVSKGSATVSFCSGSKYIQLDAPGEGADITCSGSTVLVRAYTAKKIELLKWTNGVRYVTQTYCYWVSGSGWFSYGHSVCYQYQVPVYYEYWYQIDLGPGQSVSTGSPVTAADDNTEPVHVTLLQINDDGTQVPVGSFDLDPGESADVDIAQGASRQDQIGFSALKGTVSVEMGGVTQTISEGHHTVLTLDNTPPVLAVPANITKEATSSGGAVATFSASATDDVDGSTPVICAPASGSTFPLGTTAVMCTAIDAHANPGSASFNVTVRDTTPPAVTVPANITTPATTFAGAPVNFTVSAIDQVDGIRPVACTKTSGSIISIGTTTVSCTSVDTRGNSATRTFTVTVTFNFLQARTLLATLINAVRTGNTAAACSQLTGVIAVIQTQVGQRLTQAEATVLIRIATDAKRSLGCP